LWGYKQGGGTDKNETLKKTVSPSIQLQGECIEKNSFLNKYLFSIQFNSANSPLNLLELTKKFAKASPIHFKFGNLKSLALFLPLRGVKGVTK
jgi:hypothetical protein